MMLSQHLHAYIKGDIEYFIFQSKSIYIEKFISDSQSSLSSWIIIHLLNDLFATSLNTSIKVAIKTQHNKMIFDKLRNAHSRNVFRQIPSNCPKIKHRMIPETVE